MPKQLILLACLTTLLGGCAQNPAQQPSAQTATEALLQVQSSNHQASQKLQLQTASERDQSMQRWLDTYKYAIPDVFRWEKINSSDN